jgi:hypothetical protein
MIIAAKKDIMTSRYRKNFQFKLSTLDNMASSWAYKNNTTGISHVMCSVKGLGRKSCSVSWLSLAALKLQDLISVRLFVRFFVAVTSTAVVDGRCNGKKGE